ncbi:MAG TPA: molybdopterin-dependent oxidoreductase, partial [Terriglobales bacterium]|nr:molybdopterin-dependent oxidoreductase [Terriglobales bacterium]
MSQEIDRRNFLKVGAAGVLGVATSGLALRALAEVNSALVHEQVPVPSGPESLVPSICSMCPAGCGLRIRKVGDRAVHVQGNPLHPVNHGGVCPKGVAAIQELYHPDRLRKPLRNTGNREHPQWKEISWDDALNEIAGRLGKLRDAGRARSVVFVDRGQRNLTSQLIRDFLEAYGSPNHIAQPSGMDALQAAVYLQQGISQPLAYDFENTKYLVSFGVNLLEGWGSPTTIMRAFGHWRDSASGRRTKFVQVDSRLSVTAAKADEWVAIKPGTDAALALGLAYVLISEGLYDTSFVGERSFGFDDWSDSNGHHHMGFRSLVLRDYRLNDVAEITGVPPETILRIARELAHNRPAIVLGDHQTSTLPGNTYAAMAVHSLNALLGSLEVRGGVLVQQFTPAAGGESPAAFAAMAGGSPDRVIADGALHHLPEAIAARKPQATELLILHEVDPIFEQPDGDSFRKALQSVPFVVSLTAFVNESSSLADIVL